MELLYSIVIVIVLIGSVVLLILETGFHRLFTERKEIKERRKEEIELWKRHMQGKSKKAKAIYIVREFFSFHRDLDADEIYFLPQVARIIGFVILIGGILAPLVGCWWLYDNL